MHPNGQDHVLQVLINYGFGVRPHLDGSDDSKSENRNDGKEERSQEYHEIAVILLPNTVVHPGAVMVVPLDAVVAGGAVARPGSSNNQALGTKVDRVDHLH